MIFHRRRTEIYKTLNVAEKSKEHCGSQTGFLDQELPNGEVIDVIQLWERESGWRTSYSSLCKVHFQLHVSCICFIIFDAWSDLMVLLQLPHV